MQRAFPRRSGSHGQSARGGGRTRTLSRGRDFKSLASAISPPGRRPYQSLFRSIFTGLISIPSVSSRHHRVPPFRRAQSTQQAHSRESAVLSWGTSMPVFRGNSTRRPGGGRPTPGHGPGRAGGFKGNGGAPSLTFQSNMGSLEPMNVVGRYWRHGCVLFFRLGMTG